MASAQAAEKKKKVTKKKVTKKKATAAKKTTKKKATASKKKTTKKKKGPYSLVVVESPSKAKTIKKYLGKGYQVVASNGHIKDLPKSKLGVDVKNKFETDIVPISGKGKIIEKITDLAKGAEEIFLAPDMDREGEAIAFHLKEEIGPRKKNIHRVLFNAITKKAVTEAIENPHPLDVNKYDSQRTRRILDRLVGYKISPILWDKVQRGLSAGRVQSVALRIICERENEIEAFTPEQWFSIHAHFSKDDLSFEAKYYGEQTDKKTDLDDEKFTKKIVSDIKDQDFEIVEIKKRERKQNPTPPFTTSKLQQEAANKLGYSSKKTMMIAQKLYEGIPILGLGAQGLITYMRTDSVRTDPGALESVREYIGSRYGEKFLPEAANEYKKKGKSKVQDAHEAIRPTSLEFKPEEIKPDLTDDEFKLYELIWNKFVASQMSQAIVDQTTIIFDAKGHIFRANGSIIKFAGFRQVYLESAAEKRSQKGGDTETISSKSGVLPELEKGEKLRPQEAPKEEEHWTSPPPRYNDASIVKDMEEKGIGRPSTYASIISNITDRRYVEKIENRYHPTEVGRIVSKMLVESFPTEMDIAFTAKMEDLLDQIEEGEAKWTKVLKDFWTKFEVTLEKAKDEMKNLKKQEIPTGVKCLKCEDGEYFIKWGRNGQFFACSNYPDCTSTQDFKKHYDGTYEIIPKQYFEDPCPKCDSRLIVKKGRYGRFLSCEEYPKCETNLPFYLNITCPECKKGKFAEKQSRYGKVFYGCTNYPDCNNAMWAKPIEHPCPECKHPVMGERETKRLGRHLQCPQCKETVPLDDVEESAEA